MGSRVFKVVKAIEVFSGHEQKIRYLSLSIEQPFGVEYKIGELVKPALKGSMLFVFKEYSHAQLFAPWDQVLECETYSDLTYCICASVFFTPSAITGFWEEERYKRMSIEAAKDNLAPMNTYLCKSLTPIRAIT